MHDRWDNKGRFFSRMDCLPAILRRMVALLIRRLLEHECKSLKKLPETRTSPVGKSSGLTRKSEGEIHRRIIRRSTRLLGRPRQFLNVTTDNHREGICKTN
jgi:hypothetical protein